MASQTSSPILDLAKAARQGKPLPQGSLFLDGKKVAKVKDVKIDIKTARDFDFNIPKDFDFSVLQGTMKARIDDALMKGFLGGDAGVRDRDRDLAELEYRFKQAMKEHAWEFQDDVWPMINIHQPYRSRFSPKFIDAFLWGPLGEFIPAPSPAEVRERSRRSLSFAYGGDDRMRLDCGATVIVRRIHDLCNFTRFLSYDDVEHWQRWLRNSSDRRR